MSVQGVARDRLESAGEFLASLGNGDDRAGFRLSIDAVSKAIEAELQLLSRAPPDSPAADDSLLHLATMTGWLTTMLEEARAVGAKAGS